MPVPLASLILAMVALVTSTATIISSGASLNVRSLTVNLIPDKIHVSPSLFRLVHRTMDKIFYTTDAMSAAGAGPGKHKLGSMELEVGPDQIVRRPGKTNFAGSALSPIDGVFRAAEMLGVPWQDTWKRMAEAPAQFVGMRNEIAENQPANFCVLEIADGKLQELKTVTTQ